MPTPQGAQSVEWLTDVLLHRARPLGGVAASFEIPRVLARSGRVLVTEWIEGQSGAGTIELEHAAGNLLGRIHGCKLESHELEAARTDGRPAPWPVALESQIDVLLKLGHLRPTEAVSARKWIDEFRNPLPQVGIVHRDLCLQNLVLDPTGRLWPVDNETLAVRPLDHDLGRTWTHWPMARRDWEDFFEGYESERSPQSYCAHFPFWALTACVESASFRAVHWTRGTAQPIERMRVLLSGLEQGKSIRELIFS